VAAQTGDYQTIRWGEVKFGAIWRRIPGSAPSGFSLVTEFTPPATAWGRDAIGGLTCFQILADQESSLEAAQT
jgi:hypothetical protein